MAALSVYFGRIGDTLKLARAAVEGEDSIVAYDPVAVTT
jgi:hypothetical protein